MDLSNASSALTGNITAQVGDFMTGLGGLIAIPIGIAVLAGLVLLVVKGFGRS